MSLLGRQRAAPPHQARPGDPNQSITPCRHENEQHRSPWPAEVGQLEASRQGQEGCHPSPSRPDLSRGKEPRTPPHGRAPGHRICNAARLETPPGHCCQPPSRTKSALPPPKDAPGATAAQCPGPTPTPPERPQRSPSPRRPRPPPRGPSPPRPSQRQEIPFPLEERGPPPPRQGPVTAAAEEQPGTGLAALGSGGPRVASRGRRREGEAIRLGFQYGWMWRAI